MSRLLSLALVAALAVGCNVPKNYNSNHTHLTLAAQSTLTTAVGQQIKGSLRREDRVAVVNLDGPSSEDAEIIAIVEDALVMALINNQVTVVERDSEGLRGVVQEGSGQQLEYTVTGHTEGENEPMLLDAALVTGGGPTRVLVNGTTFVEVPPNTAFLDQGPDGGDDRLTTHDPDLKNEVVAASKILAYRIVDVQIRDYTYKRQTYRFANIVLAVRIVDAEYGTVVWSGTIQNVVEDKVPAIIAPKLRR